MKNLYFIDSNRNYRLIAENIERSEVFKNIHQFLEEHNYKSYYTRTWACNGGVMYDVGSHSEFFFWGDHKEK